MRELKEDVFEGIDIAIFSAGGSTSEKYAPHAAAAGASSWTTPARGAWTNVARWSCPK